MSSPGPTTAGPYNSYGRQTLSTRGTSPGWGFGTSKVGEPRGWGMERGVCGRGIKGAAGRGGSDRGTGDVCM
jgi:hypothetical protein